MIAALTPDAADAPSDDERAVSIDGLSGTERDMPIARGDYRQFYVELAAAVRGAASNPVPLDQALAVVAVVETAIRSSAERRALTVPLTNEEIARFNVIASKGV